MDSTLKFAFAVVILAAISAVALFGVSKTSKSQNKMIDKSETKMMQMLD